MSLKHGGQIAGTNKRLLYAKFQRSSEIPAIILFLIKRHIVKDEDSARRLVVTIVLIILLTSAYLFFRCTSGPIFIDRISK